jgi:hypothetical protein
MLKILRFQGFDALHWGLDEEVSVLWYRRWARRVVLTTSNAFVRSQASKAGMLAETGIGPSGKCFGFEVVSCWSADCMEAGALVRSSIGKDPRGHTNFWAGNSS